MAKTASHARFYPFPYSHQVFDSRIQRITEVAGARRSSEVQLDLRALRPLGAPELRIEDGRPWEVQHGELIGLRLRFLRANWVRRTGFFSQMEALPPEHSARRLFDVLHLRLPGQERRYWIFADINTPGHEACLRAAECVLEELPEPVEPASVRRRWALRPPAPAGLVPRPAAVHRRHGGDPIAVRLGRRVYRQRLFIGGLHHQSELRPLVGHVLNLCGEPNPWIPSYGMHPADRVESKGELADGMTGEEMVTEAQWVAERLRAGERVLVHCHAGVNRSSTVCCAALMLLEGLTAEAALSRVRERHPEAAPDPYHWFLLRWLERGEVRGLESTRQRAPRTRPLREVAAIG
jgi:Dual specificity phosphatase, catalytic domain